MGQQVLEDAGVFQDSPAGQVSQQVDLLGGELDDV